MKQPFVSLSIILSTGLTFLGNGMHFIALSWLVFDLTNDPLAVGLLVTFTTIPGMVVSPLAGVLADKFNKKRVVVFMDIIRCVLVLLIVVALHFNFSSLWILYFITIMITVANNLFFPSLSGIIKRVIPQEDFLKIISANSTSLQIGMIVGSGLGGILIGLTSIKIVFIIDAITFLISSLLLIRIKYEPLKESTTKLHSKSFWNDFNEGLKYVFTNKTLVLLFFLGAFPYVISQLINALLAYYTENTLNMGVEAYGLLDASFAVGSVVMGLYLMTFIKSKIKLNTIVAYSFVLISMGTLLLAFSKSLIISLIGLAIIGAGVLSQSTSIKTLFVSYVDEEFIGRAESLSWTIYSSVPPLLGLLSTAIVEQVSLEIIFLLISIVFFSLFIFSNGSLKKVQIKDAA